MKKNKFLYSTLLLISIFILMFYVYDLTTTGSSDQTMDQLTINEQKNKAKNEVESENVEVEVGIQKWNKAPDFTLSDQTGKQVKLSDFTGKKVLLNFWASWCGPCRNEIPDLIKYYEENRDQDVVVLAVNMTATEKHVDDAIELINEMKMSFPIGFDEEGKVQDQFRVKAYPTSYLIDSKGIIQHVIIGQLSYDDIQVMMSEVQ